MTERPEQQDHQTDWWFIAWCEECDSRYEKAGEPVMKQPFSDVDARNTWAMEHSRSTPKGTHKVKVWTEDRLTHERVKPGGVVIEQIETPMQINITEEGK